jgi:hypothetical protein
MTHGFKLALGPGSLRRSHRLVGVRHAQNANIIKAVAYDLQSDRHSVGIVAGANRGGGLFRLVGS